MIGGAGDDMMFDFVGNDVYKGFIGDFGVDLIEDQDGSADVLDLSNYALADIKSWEGADWNDVDNWLDQLVINFNNGSTIIINGYFYGDPTVAGCTEGFSYIESIKLADADLDFAQIQNLAHVALHLEGNDLANELLTGTAGEDILVGLGGDDTLIGGFGNDHLYGGDGNDCYKSFNGNFENDVLNDTAGNDTLDLSNYNLADVVSWTAVDGADSDNNLDSLRITFAGGNSIQLLHYFSNTTADVLASTPGAGCLETLIFADNPNVQFGDVQSLAS
jgi:Ca2+-binding RTX toxin-like protein